MIHVLEDDECKEASIPKDGRSRAHGYKPDMIDGSCPDAGYSKKGSSVNVRFGREDVVVTAYTKAAEDGKEALIAISQKSQAHYPHEDMVVVHGIKGDECKE